MVRFAKGHGTENDFVILPDPEAEIALDDATIRALCDRHRGLGADGVLRVATAGALVRQGVLEELPDDVAHDDWFMDYHNADGSIAEMCGNGVRVFAHYVAGYLNDAPEFSRQLRVATRAGLRPVTIHSLNSTNAQVSVVMGAPVAFGVGSAHVGDKRFAGLAVDVGNPHLACVIPSLDSSALQRLRLTSPVEVSPELFPQGVNLEILTPMDGENTVHMRVIERGVGETRSCGTGTVAAALAALADAEKQQGSVTVEIPGGRVQVDIELDGDGHYLATLTGPSVIHSHGDIDLNALR